MGKQIYVTERTVRLLAAKAEQYPTIYNRIQLLKAESKLEYRRSQKEKKNR